ncbi:hypothetical protein DENIS_4766 [Desulfonema ishimotonii]|uniref:Uncharacterized protein n=1 Tax=Desulfonema ishimotonii TaxID=45657 RepID=A0A401G3E4_9BACT|nr:hypothetical protein [Desulfonema ishimotonii]GBC63768.1 hypothetical protein DENIS_4766 [Desulfonema ishimotonii]
MSIFPAGNCQIHALGQMAERGDVAGTLWQRRNRLRRIVKRRWNYLVNLASEIAEPRKGAESARPDMKYGSRPLQPGDMVRVRSEKEIQATLNRWNQLRGCSFMEEMQPHCGTVQRVFKRIEKFLDERDYLIKRCGGIVILEGVLCSGTRDFGACDRACFFFWREEWLEKTEEFS